MVKVSLTLATVGGLGSLLTGQMQDGRIVIDAVLLLVSYIVARHIILLRDELREQRSQLIGTKDMPGAVPRLEKEVRDLRTAIQKKEG